MSEIETISDCARQAASLAIEIENRASKIADLQKTAVQAALRIGNAIKGEL